MNPWRSSDNEIYILNVVVSSWFYTSDEPFKLYPGVPWPLVCLLGMQSCVPLTLLHRNPLQTTTVIEPALHAAMESLNSGLALSRECMFLGSSSYHNKDLERRTLKPSASQLSGLGQTVLQLLGKSVLQLYFI